MKKQIRAALIAITVLFLFILIILSGTDYNPTAGLHITIDSALCEQHTDAASVIIDDSSRRAIFLNPDGTCAKVLTSGIKSQKVTYYSALSVTDDAVYIAEYTRFANSAYVETESLVRYSLRGKKEATVFTLTHTMEDSRSLDPFLVDVQVSGDSGSAILLDAVDQKLYLYHFAADSENLTVSLSDSAVTLLPDAFTEGLMVQAVFDENDPARIIVRSSENHFAYTDEALSFTSADSDIPLVNAVTLELDNSGRVSAGLTCDCEGKTIAFDGRIVALCILYWVCWLWIVLSVVTAVIAVLRRHRKKQEYGNYRTLLTIVAVVLISGFIVIFYSVNMINNSYEETDGVLRSYATILYASAQDELTDCLKEYRETSSLDAEKQEKLERIFEENSRLLADEGQDVTFILTAMDQNDTLYQLGDSSMRTMAGSYIGSSREKYPELSQTDSALVSGTVHDQWIETSMAAVRFYDEDGSEIGCLICQTDSQVLLAWVLRSSLSLFIRLLSIIITAGFLITEGREWMQGRRKNRQLKEAQYPHPEVAFTHSVAFMAVLTASVNSVLLSVIVNHMVKNAGLPANGFYISLPIILSSIGFLLGSSTRAVLVRRFPQKRVLLSGTVVAALGYALCYYCVRNSNLFLFAAGILITNTSVGIIHSFSMDLSFHAKDDAERVTLNRSVSIAVIAGSSIAGTLSGFLAKLLGNAAIELLGVAFSVCLFILVLYVIPGGKHAEEAVSRDTARSRRGILREIRRFLSDRQALSILMFMSLPVEIIYGYKSYLFPLLATDAGMDQSLVSSIVVFCTAAVFYSAPVISWLEQELGTKRIMLCAAVVMSAAMMLFTYNRTMGWAIVTLAVIIMGIKIIEPAVISSWQQRAMAVHVEYSAASTTATVFKYCGESVRSPIFVSVWNAVGVNLTCGLTGAGFLVCSGMLGALCRLQERKK